MAIERPYPGIALVFSLCFSCAPVYSQQPAAIPALSNPPQPCLRADLPGQQPDGSVLLFNQWSLRPAGHQIPLGDFPENIAVHPSGRFAAVLHCGFAEHEIVLVDLKTEKVASRIPVPEAYYGIEFSHSGERLYCSGAGDEVVHIFNFKRGTLRAERDIRLRPSSQRGIPCGLTLSRDEEKLYVANVWGQRVTLVDLAQPTNTADIELAPAPGEEPTYQRQKSVNSELAAITKRAKAPLDPTSPMLRSLTPAVSMRSSTVCT